MSNEIVDSPKFLAFISQDGEHLGSGVAINPRHVITCRHVVHGSPKEALSVNLGGKHYEATNINDTSNHDLAVITLKESHHCPNVIFAVQVTNHFERNLIGQRLRAWGCFQSGEENRVSLHSCSVELLSPRFDEDGLLVNSQLFGGIESGFSGGAVLIGTDEVCLGIAYLGGERAATSRVLSGDTVVAFARHLGLEISSIPFTSQMVANNGKTTETPNANSTLAPMTNGRLGTAPQGCWHEQVKEAAICHISAIDIPQKIIDELIHHLVTVRDVHRLVRAANQFKVECSGDNASTIMLGELCGDNAKACLEDAVANSRRHGARMFYALLLAVNDLCVLTPSSSSIIAELMGKLRG